MSEPPEKPEAPQYENVGIDYRSWEEVEADLRRLDGESSDSIFIAAQGQDHMSIAGGNDGRYVVQARIGRGCFVCSSGKSDGSIKDVAACWDYVPFPSANVLDLETAIAAAREFYATGGLAPQLKWDKC